MLTTVVNKRATSTFDVYIGRGSAWGNPFIIGKHGDRAAVIAAYETYLLSRPALLTALPQLRGKTLACFCAPLPCHGNVLAKYADHPELLAV